MALEEYVGAVVVEVDGREIEAFSCSPSANTGRKPVKTMIRCVRFMVLTGRKPVKTMNRTHRNAGYTNGVYEYTLDLSVPVEADGDTIDWENVIDAKVVIYPVKGNRRTAYTGCVVTEVGEQYETENEARRDIKMFAQDKKEE